ncbi:MAG: hypothetical protein JOZ53_24560 [Planctomycetaceae bacterium]|jgi:hypothetical protein|nr:hypothetical protein [Planctomycetaceae bacterium]
MQIQECEMTPVKMNVDPYRPPSANVADCRTEPNVGITWGRATKVWWSLTWRWLLFSVITCVITTFISGFVIGFVIGFIKGAAGVSVSNQTIETVSTVAVWTGVFTSIPVGIWVVRSVLRKSWSDFRIALVPIQRG